MTLTYAATYESLRSEGGTTSALAQLLAESNGIVVKELDLETGTEGRTVERDEHLGTYVFWLAIDQIRRMPPGDLSKVYMTVVKEPGKARAVTKGLLVLKIVLDVINKICSWPLKKGLESSHSGMGRAHHGWNLFKRFFQGEWRDEVFRPSKVETTQLDNLRRIQTVVYEELLVAFTDYEEATDHAHHEVAALVGELWMKQCGIPKLLRGIVHATCYQPRLVFFRATGPLKTIGDPTDISDVRCITLRRGILMGDPLTKVVLHLINAGVRQLGRDLADGEALYPICSNPSGFAADIRYVNGNR